MAYYNQNPPPVNVNVSAPLPPAQGYPQPGYQGYPPAPQPQVFVAQAPPPAANSGAAQAGLLGCCAAICCCCAMEECCFLCA